MKLYIVAKPFDEIKQFLPVYITTHKDKAQTFWHLYTDESINLIIFSKEWEPSDNNIIFAYWDEHCEEGYGCEEHNTLFGKYKEWIEMDEDEASLYDKGDPNEERVKTSKYESYNPKIWELK